MTRSSVSTSRRARLAVALSALSLLGALVAAAPARAETAPKVLVSGGGWGHGIGMSQYGAYGMAQKGRSASAILKHYYRGVDLAQKSMPAVRVGLSQYRSSYSFNSRALKADGGKVRFEIAGGDAIASGGTAPTWRIEASSTGRMRLYKNGDLVRKAGRRAFGSPDKPFHVVFERFGSSVYVHEKANAYAYGILEVDSFSSSSCSSGYCLRLIAKLSMQKYLYGLGEVPSSWPQATLQAQAIAGRTYAYRKIQAYGQHTSPCDCSVVDSVYDQAFIGDAKRTGSGQWWADWKRAVDETAGKVLLHDGSPIQALYSSSSGGHTENNENVWGGTAIPYLRGVDDPADRVSINPNHSWSFTMTRSDLSSKLNAYYGIGSLKRIVLRKPFGVSGRVTVVRSSGGGVKIVGTNKTVYASGWSLRSALGLRDTLFRMEGYWNTWTKFVEKHRALDGRPGLAKSAAYYIPKGMRYGLGRAQNFERGRMTWRRKTDRVVWQYGQVLKRYDRIGREKSVLGMPVTDIWGPGRFLGATYVNGAIVWSDGNGAHPIVGRFFDAWESKGATRGRLGAPLGVKQTADSLPDGGRRQRFVRGTLYSNPHEGGVFALWGKIAERYRKLGEGGSACGYPVAHQKVVDGNVQAEFEQGTITYSKALGVDVSCNKSQ